MKIADLPQEVKPREKAFRYGIESLSDGEVLAIIIGSGIKGHSAIEIGKSLIETFITLSNLERTSLNSLQKIPGLHKVNALKLIASFELHRRLISPLYSATRLFDNALQIHEHFRYMENYDYEAFVLVMMNRKKEIIREVTKYRGTAKSINFDCKEIISDLLESKCKYFVLVHNHPDGATEPSQNDVVSTMFLKEKAEEFDVYLFDHVIIFKDGYYSFKERGHFR